MPKSKQTKKAAKTESDGAYLLKLVLYLIIGAQWVQITTKSGSKIPLPVGLLIGAIFTLHEHFQIDRKIEYAVLLVAMFVGYWTQTGLFIHL
ncbi:MAG TPA: hypothetical protein VG992_02355 [Candidatus Saccharimonadales bacterium]|nr:hypothetical protein [Candidatus Saccharimonadales bacterium]